MRLGLTTAAFYGRLETEEAAAHLRAFDVDCAEVFLQTSSEYAASFGMTVRDALGAIPATSVHPLGTAFETVCSAHRAGSVRMRSACLRAYCALRRRSERVAMSTTDEIAPGESGWKRPSNRTRCALRNWGRRLPLMAYACAGENVSWCQLTSPERVRAVRRTCPHVGFVLDIKQAMQSGYDAVEFAREMGDRLCNVHVCDFDASGRLCLPGRGVYDFVALGKTLCAMGYDGPVILEPYANLFQEDAELAEALAYLRNTMQIASQKTANRDTRSRV